MSASESVGKSMWICEMCKVNRDPARVAVFFITQTTSSPFNSATCIMKPRGLLKNANKYKKNKDKVGDNFNSCTKSANQINPPKLVGEDGDFCKPC